MVTLNNTALLDDDNGPDPAAILNLLTDAVIAVGEGHEIRYVNYAAEQMFGMSSPYASLATAWTRRFSRKVGPRRAFRWR